MHWASAEPLGEPRDGSRDVNSLTLLGVYSVGIVAASVIGIWVQSVIRLTHTRVQLAMSFVAGLVIGVAMYHLLPHGFERIAGESAIEVAVWWMLVGIVLMVLLLRVFPLHQHDQAEEECEPHGRDSGVDSPSLNWLGIAFGMGLHGLTEGTALGAAVLSRGGDLAGVDLVSFGVFLAIVLHKPLDAFVLLGMMRVAGLGKRYAYVLSVVTALICPLGAFVAFWGIGLLATPADETIGRALAFGAGALVCISLSDLLPEIHFHRHDRFKLTVAFIVGLALAYALHVFENSPH